MRRALLVLGSILLALSLPPLLLMAREVLIGWSVARQYSAHGIKGVGPEMHGGALSAEIGGHRVALSDDQPYSHEPFKTEESQRGPGVVQVLVDGQAVSAPVAATVRRTFKDANRYWGFVYLFRLTDRSGPERLVVAQNLGEQGYRTISVFADGRVVEDSFEYAERCAPPLRAALIRYVVNHPSGYCSDLLQVWPSLWYPVLYPWMSGVAGATLLLLGMFRARARPTVREAMDSPDRAAAPLPRSLERGDLQ
jgi:hypothetical protein